MSHEVQTGLFAGLIVDDETFKKTNKQINIKSKELFLEVLSQTGLVRTAADAIGVSEPSIYSARYKDESFAKAWDETIERSKRPLLIAELHDRVFKGTPEAVYYKGEEVGKQWRKSDNLLMFYIKEAMPQFRDRLDVNMGGTVSFETTPEVQGILDAVYTALPCPSFEDQGFSGGLFDGLEDVASCGVRPPTGTGEGPAREEP